ncbi:hypothetical protein P2W68_17055 [Chryseobacterium arthrosphaerae]|uniref:hypothetical protein n=1 Tax=Chryseobacterium arthrosphaerae TaxID=651561 RepID=UPI0023E34CC1|nr:hypothetical protein [Chryseobacterium arthrosphaerae]WES96543.1 hypothetical protein P2W68_17055 [Chryseobacterium arthrosphaerae]
MDYFSGKDIKILEQDDNYIDVLLSNHESSDYYIDPNILEGLQWWDKSIMIKQIPDQFRNLVKYQLSLNDNWTIYSWSLWLEQRLLENDVPNEIVILHIDDHTDCMSPLLFKKDNLFINPFNNEEVNLFNPNTVRRAIESGAISIGSFMTLFLHSMPRIQFRHLMPKHRLSKVQVSGKVNRGFLSDETIQSYQERPLLSFSPSEGIKSNLEYSVFTEIDDFLKDISDTAAIFLHVDMDYFNNRFDGDSDWRSHEFNYDPSAKIVYKNIEETFSTIEKAILQRELKIIRLLCLLVLFQLNFGKKVYRLSIEC